MQTLGKPQLRKVTLPKVGEIEISDSPLPWWGHHGGAGYVAPQQCAPDPTQPRKEMYEFDFAELVESVKEHGVREAITVTPKHLAPWVTVGKEHEGCYFLIVSGHRRRATALSAEIAAIPVTVKIYRNESEYRDDMVILNEKRVDLSPLEEGYEIVRECEAGATIEQVSRRFGFSAPALYVRIHLTKLSPALQRLLHRNTPKKDLLPTGLGGALGGIRTPTPEEFQNLLEQYEHYAPKEWIQEKQKKELEDKERTYALQELLHYVIRARNLRSTAALDFVSSKTHELKDAENTRGRRVRRHEPHKRLEILKNLLETTQAHAVFIWAPAELERVFQLLTREDTEWFLNEVGRVELLFRELGSRLSTIRDKKPITRPEVLAFIRSQKKGVG